MIILLWPWSGRLLTFRWRGGIRAIDGHEAIVLDVGTPSGTHSPACASRRPEEKERALAKKMPGLHAGFLWAVVLIVDAPTIHNRMDFVDVRFAGTRIEYVVT